MSEHSKRNKRTFVVAMPLIFESRDPLLLATIDYTIISDDIVYDNKEEEYLIIVPRHSMS